MGAKWPVARQAREGQRERWGGGQRAESKGAAGPGEDWLLWEESHKTVGKRRRGPSGSLVRWVGVGAKRPRWWQWLR